MAGPERVGPLWASVGGGPKSTCQRNSVSPQESFDSVFVAMGLERFSQMTEKAG